MRWLLLALVACATSRNEQVRTSSEDYRDAKWWVCRPDLPTDACRGDLATTILEPDGKRTVEQHAPARDSKVDCFYIYPTVDLSLLPGNHVDFSNLDEIKKTAAAQIARFSEVCNVYSPLYRQATIATYFSTKGDKEHFFDVAYSDIAAAFAVYRAQFAADHRIVIIGHSQGSQMAMRLLNDVFDNDPAMRARLVVAMPIGFTVEVPGTFPHLKPCESADQTGCVVSYLSIAAGDEPSRFVNKVPKGSHALCVAPNEASTLRESVFPSRGKYPTPYVAVRDYYTAHCLDEPNGSNYLAIAEAPWPNDQRPHLVDLGKSNGGLGMHVYDLQFTQGDLIELIRRKISRP